MNSLPEILSKEQMTDEERNYVCSQLMTTESHMEHLILKYFTEDDFRRVWERKIGDGVIGGKDVYKRQDFNNVDFPQPEGPINAVISFAWILKSIPFKALKSP